MDELINKVINSINNNNSNVVEHDGSSLSSLALSYKEASLLTVGVVKGQTSHSLCGVARLSPEDRDLKARAMEAARTDDIRAAREVAQKVQQRWLAVELAAAQALNDDDIMNSRFAMKVPWQEHVLQSTSNSTVVLLLVLVVRAREVALLSWYSSRKKKRRKEVVFWSTNPRSERLFTMDYTIHRG